MCCKGCPLDGFVEGNCDGIYSDEFADNVDWDRLALIIEDWAKENPEPKYPTWYDYLFSIGVFYNEHTAGGDVTKIHWGNTMTPIPADIAEELGIQPEEE